MKCIIPALAAIGGLIFATAAEANNATVESALKNRPELSIFYAKLQETGVLNELHAWEPYTVFAPTNAAFAQVPQEKYPCFYTAECSKQLAAVLRRHIVLGEKHINDKLAPGGIFSMFSIDNQHVTATELGKGEVKVDGRNVLKENQLLGGDLYELDGLLMTDGELAQFTPPTIIVDQAPPAPPPAPLPPKVIVTTHTDATTPQPF